MNNDIKVSVIIPVYNTEKYLRRCLDSVCDQTLTTLEIICIDDASSDGSAAVLAEYAARDPRLKVITYERNRGVSAARNAGIEAATGEYLGFIDSDDEVDLDFFSKLYTQASVVGADVVKGSLREIDCAGRESVSSQNDLIRQKRTRFAFAWHWWTAIYKASVVRDCGIRFLEGQSIGEDVLFLNEFMLHSKSLVLVDDTFYHYHRRGDSSDSFILTPEKVRSAVGVHGRIIENVLFAGDAVDDAGKRFVCSQWFKASLEIAYRLKTQSSLRECIDRAFDIYGRVVPWIVEDDLLSLPAALPFFKSGDKAGLYAFMQKNDTPQKMMLANLRCLQIRRKRKD